MACHPVPEQAVCGPGVCYPSAPPTCAPATGITLVMIKDLVTGTDGILQGSCPVTSSPGGWNRTHSIEPLLLGARATQASPLQLLVPRLNRADGSLPPAVCPLLDAPQELRVKPG